MPTGSAFTTPDDWNSTSPLSSARLQTIAEDLQFLFLRTQTGVDSFSFAATATVNRTITFPTAFSVAPRILLTAECASVAMVAFVLSRTATSFTYQMATLAGTSTSVAVTLHWAAHR